MRIKKLAEILNVDVRRLARQYFKKELEIVGINVEESETGDSKKIVIAEFEGERKLKFKYDCNYHLLDWSE